MPTGHRGDSSSGRVIKEGFSEEGTPELDLMKEALLVDTVETIPGSGGFSTCKALPPREQLTQGYEQGCSG